MLLKFLLKFVFGVLLLLAAPINALAQDCPTPDANLWTTFAGVCADVPAGGACFAGGQATVKARSDAPDFSFASPGDKTEAGAIKSIDLEANSAALIDSAANLKTGEATLILFGKAQIKDLMSGKYKAPAPAGQADNNFTIQANTWYQGTLLNRTPQLLSLDTVATLDANVTVTVNARTGDTPMDYVRAVAPDGSVGWIGPAMFKLPDGTSLDQSPDFLKLPLVDAGSASGGNHTPFQRLTFESAPCAGNGLLISTPKTDGHAVWFEINGQTVALHSTIYIYGTADGDTVYVTLEGSAIVYLGGTAVAIPGGTQVTVLPDGTFGPLQPYDPAIIGEIPTGMLPADFVPDPPLTPEQINLLATPPPSTEPGFWALELWFWEVDGDCPYPAQMVNAMPVMEMDFTWDGGPSDLIQYWTSGQAQSTAQDSGINFDFTQNGGDYIFSSLGKTTTNQLIFRRVGPYSFAVFSSIASGDSCVLTGKGILEYIGVKS
jgi:hypothetical protein